jgi:ADP-heptose:LPS heptosyltransferase
MLRALGLGDFLTGVPAMRALGRAFPHHERVLAAPAWQQPLVAHTGVAERVAPTEGLMPLDTSLGGCEIAVDLHGRGPGSQPLLLALRPGRLMAFEYAGIAATIGLPRWRAEEHEVTRWCRLLRECGVPADPGDLRIDPPDTAVPGRARGATLIHPGAGSPARRWPVDRFAAVARHERRQGREVIVTGSTHETGLADRLARLAGLEPSRVQAGCLTVLELAGLVARAGRVVCGDTGVAHLATALGTPSVVLCGPVSPHLWGPPPGQSRHVTLWAGTTGDPHGRTVDPGLLRISVAEVLAALSELDDPGR